MSDIVSRPPTDAYREGWERTFGPKPCPLCAAADSLSPGERCAYHSPPPRTLVSSNNALLRLLRRK